MTYVVSSSLVSECSVQYRWFSTASRQLRKAISWIAFNDNEGNGDGVDSISNYLTVALTADINRVSREQLAQVIWLYRKANKLV